MTNLKLFLAPMEGVVDWVMRDTLTQIGGIDQCVTEFIRVVENVYPDHVFYKNCPELKTDSKTRAGVPVFVQILGGRAEPMALNAQRAIALGACGVDINFGCPAKTVNKNDGGATLLKSCDRIFDIVSQVRKAVPKEKPVSVKIRLGFEEPTACVDVAQAIEDAGASFLTVHCRTKVDGYKPPAYWEWIPRIKEKIKIDLIANGEIWNTNDFKRCHEVTNCSRFMIGRGALSDPFIFNKIKKLEINETANAWENTQKILPKFFEASVYYRSNEFAVARTKQWLKALSLNDLKAREFFDEIKILKNPQEFQSVLERLS